MLLTFPLNLTRRHCHLVLSIVNVLSVFISWFCAWSFAVLKTILCILQSQWLVTTFTLIYLTYLFDERRLELRWCRWSPFLLGDQERDLECGVHDFKFCQKIAGFNKKENIELPSKGAIVFSPLSFPHWITKKSIWRVDSYDPTCSYYMTYYMTWVNVMQRELTRQ